MAAPTISSTADTAPSEVELPATPAADVETAASSSLETPHESPWHDYCRVLRQQLAYLHRSESCFVVGVSSLGAGAGVTSVVSHLGSNTAAETNAAVLLIDANLGDPLLARLFSLEAGPGLLDALVQGDLPLGLFHATDVPGLKVVPAGERASATSEVEPPAAVSLQGLKQLLSSAKRDFDLVLVDLPPLTESSWAASVASLLDGVLLVVEAGHDETSAAQQALTLLAPARARLLGVVLNKQLEPLPAWLDRR